MLNKAEYTMLSALPIQDENLVEVAIISPYSSYRVGIFIQQMNMICVTF